MNIREIFALNLRTLRNDKGFSQEELAHRANVHRTYVSSLERCVYSPTIDMVDGLAKILGVEAFELLVSKRLPGPQKLGTSDSDYSSDA
ncbi:MULTISPECIES: helix-turn-helix domain-containing protein [unclassified Rhizobium]|uniref:helix-turn-helix domain-containing protein n=1 Tax=unclassified Rhizobium TaxID=2613769 RepID=UPI001ADB936F|nr:MULTISPECIES: helix-turn-helix transcriptional regulator [unclassified Rhizobium]MBO9101914.1 helix-turn-helix transcriptional regulator [Rhizobium sp. L58/93]MBO9172085.1 helix-turn-helix transcriptional regulator [Rhizobium sp. L245/93]QXZ88303.1 helix-turn-helix transcriptional regulator [Rhizobium sp. K1/93]QXZ94274.1 helix-turn-helix transcriptional regulator [Rhizobium sp. K15/93]QYA05637.1 helix-turn-helix transcriptional regulator [Rhizobium sp. B21/90]